jgi:hypothetical protein
MVEVMEDVQSDFPNEDEALNVAEALGEIFERNLLRDYVVPRILNNMELNWLRANNVAYAIRSSVNQFVEGHYLRIQVLDKTNQLAWRKWREL